MAIPCKSVDEAVQALDGQFGYKNPPEYLNVDFSQVEARVAAYMLEPSECGKEKQTARMVLPKLRKGGRIQLQKAIEDMRKLVEERIEMRMFDVWSDRPAEDQSTEESAPAGLESLADVLPDLYGRKEHAAYMARTARAEHAQNVGRKTAVQLRVRSLMDGLCGKHRGMED